MRATRVIVSILGALLGMSGMIHGYRETLLGNTPTGGLILASVGAFSVIPNYLVTGIAAMSVGLLAAIWSVGFIQRKNGPLIFILLFFLLFLVGGGFGQVAVFTLTWAMSTRINKPLVGLRNIIPDGLRKNLARLWLRLFMVSMFFFAVGIEIWLFNFVPGVNDALQKLYICWMFLVIGLGVLLVDLVAVFAQDIERQMDSSV